MAFMLGKMIFLVLALTGLVLSHAINDSIAVGALQNGTTITKHVGTSQLAERAASSRLIEFTHNASTPVKGPLNGTSSSGLKIEPGAWGQVLEKGLGLSCQFNPDSQPPASPWTNYQDLQRYGWERTELDSIDVHDYESIFRAMNIPTAWDNLKMVHWEHSHAFTNRDGQHADGTGAWCQTCYNVQSGVIINTVRESPKKTLERRRRNRETTQTLTPDLERSSDIIWLEWAELNRRAGTDPASLRFIFSYIITTDLTKDVIREAVRRQGETLGEWPAGVRQVDLSSVEGKALLGTPHGFGNAYLLLDHRASIHKKISSFVVWVEDPDDLNNFHMVTELEDI